MTEVETLMAAMAEMKAQMVALQASADAATKLAADQALALQANAAVVEKVKPHSDGLRKVADNMEAAGIGCHASAGHVQAIRKMAASMDTDAAQGKTPSDYYNGGMYAGASPTEISTMVASAVAAAVKPQDNGDVAKMTDALAAMGTKIADLQASQAKQKTAPERRTLPPTVTALLARAGVSAPGTDVEKMSIHDLDETLKKTSMTLGQKMEVKAALRHSGMLQ